MKVGIQTPLALIKMMKGIFEDVHQHKPAKLIEHLTNDPKWQDFKPADIATRCKWQRVD